MGCKGSRVRISPSRPFSSFGQIITMDPLLKLLEEHALRTPVDLSKMLNLPADEVQRRIKQYEDDKIILGYKAVINDDKVDTDLVKAVIEVKIQPEREG